MRIKYYVQGNCNLKVGYANVFKTYNTGETQLSLDIMNTKREARKEAKILRMCGHTKVRTIKVLYSDPE